MILDVSGSVRDPDRLLALRKTGLLDSEPEESFDHLTRIAGRLLDAPVAMVNLVDEDRQFTVSWYVPSSWTGARQTPLEDSFCKYVVQARDAVLIDDARADPRTAETRTVTERGLRSYLGIPLAAPDGHVLGALCVADFKPRGWNTDRVELLREITGLVAREIRVRDIPSDTQETDRLAAIVDRERSEKIAVLDSTMEGIYGIDRNGRCTFINPGGAGILGYTASEVVGQRIHELIHHTRPDGAPYPEAECPMIRTLRDGSSIRLSNELFWRKDGARVPVEYSSSAILDGGRVSGAVVTFMDVTGRRRDAATQRFLSRASDVLAASSLDYAATLRSLADLAVPTLGDWCAIYVSGADGGLDRLEVAHDDPAKVDAVEALRAYPLHNTPVHSVIRVVETGEAVLMKTIPESAVDAVAPDAAHRKILEELGLRSAIIVPLTARGRTLGALAVVVGNAKREYGQDDLAVTQEFAHRAALAVDNARLFQRSQEANQAKSDFLATISHELRTPLNAVTGYAELMQQGIPERLGAKSQEYIERIRLSARHLMRLIDEVLSFSRIESGRETLKLEQVSIPELLEEMRAVVEPLAHAKGLRLVVDFPEEEQSVRTDAGKLRQVLLNLLDNAVKFTRKGEVSFAVRTVGDSVVFEVKDTGVGIRQVDRERIFQPFSQAEPTTTRSTGGAGLGLTLAQRLIQLLGGKLSLASAPGSGATFTMQLPILGPPTPAGAD